MQTKKAKFLIGLFCLVFAFDLPLVTFGDATYTENVSVTAIVGSIVTVPTSSTSGGAIDLPETSILFSGYAYPGATVFLMKNGLKIKSVIALSDASFSITLSEEYESSSIYTLYAQDIAGERSLLLNYPVVVRNGYTTYVTGIIFPPTIITDKIEVLLGDYISLSGYARPNKEIDIFINEDQYFKVISDGDGLYSLTTVLAELNKGEYYFSSRYIESQRVSKLVRFTIGDKNVLNTKLLKDIPGDCNADHFLNLVDFSVLSYWYKRPNPPKCLDTNNDKIINLVDFSILAYYWTG